MMMKKKHIEWSLLAPLGLFGLAVLCIILYLFTSSIPVLQTVLGMGSMVIVMLAGLSMLVPMVLVTLDILQSGMDGGKKVIWLGATWLLLGYVAAAAYYFMEVRKRQE